MVKGTACSALNLFVIMLCIQLVSSQLPADQVSAMTRVYEIIQNNTGSSFVWHNVLQNSSPCSWKGVVCSPDNSSIINLSFKSFSVSTSEFFPFVCNISTLESVDVSNNQLSSIPDGFYTGCGEISGLKLLNFSENELKGSLPSFNGFAVLENLDFSRNSLSGEIGLQLDGLGSLKSLNLGWNAFGGKIPTNLGKLNLLEELVLFANMFSGDIPVEITKYRNLRVVDLSANLLSGSIPGELAELSRLQTLVLSQNNMSGGIPTSLANITTLRRFAANLNRFNGSIPPGITSHLEYLDLSYNELTGSIPPDLLSRENLLALDLTSNKLEGSIPEINSTKMFRLRLGSNSFNGTIPSTSLGSHLELTYLELDGNSLSGGIPSELGMLRKLALLNLAQNRLTGVLPPELGMQNMRYLDLKGNSLRGPIPDSIGYLSSLIELQLGNNQLSGRIPDMPSTLQIALNLSHNLFDGPIPVSLSRLVNLEVLDLSNNRFSGEIPDFLTVLSSLTHLLLMNNELSGVIPVFGPHVEVDTMGNGDLIEPRENPLPTPQGKKISIGSDLVISVASGIPVGLLISVIAIFISRRYNKIHGHLSPPNSIHSSTIDFKRAMEAVADPSNITLNTTFSTFYKAVMPSGTTYLIKEVNHTNKILQFPRHNELVEELELLGNLSHANVMIPIAYVLTVHKAYLCYDFVRGTLHDILHQRRGIPLAWESRYNIAVGVAKGLAYLHECTSGPIILLDLCSKNILLKSLDEPQISDIELCKMIHPSQDTKRATAAGNVYSFGVVLLELLTGKPAVSGDSDVAKWVLSNSNQPHKWHEILDLCETSSVGVRNQMFAVLEVASACITTSPEMRPNTVTVLQMLLRPQ